MGDEYSRRKSRLFPVNALSFLQQGGPIARIASLLLYGFALTIALLIASPFIFWLKSGEWVFPWTWLTLDIAVRVIQYLAIPAVFIGIGSWWASKVGNGKSH